MKAFLQGHLAALISIFLLFGCAEPVDGGGSSAAGDPQQAVEVGYVKVAASNVPLTTQPPGRTTAFEVSEVRPQMSGVIQRLAFQQGSLVKPGQLVKAIPRRTDDRSRQGHSDHLLTDKAAVYC